MIVDGGLESLILLIVPPDEGQAMFLVLVEGGFSDEAVRAGDDGPQYTMSLSIRLSHAVVPRALFVRPLAVRRLVAGL